MLLPILIPLILLSTAALNQKIHARSFVPWQGGKISQFEQERPRCKAIEAHPGRGRWVGLDLPSPHLWQGGRHGHVSSHRQAHLCRGVKVDEITFKYGVIFARQGDPGRSLLLLGSARPSLCSSCHLFLGQGSCSVTSLRQAQLLQISAGGASNQRSLLCLHDWGRHPGWGNLHCYSMSSIWDLILTSTYIKKEKFEGEAAPKMVFLQKGKGAPRVLQHRFFAKVKKISQ